jgi:LPS-assembly lipoprotein
MNKVKLTFLLFISLLVLSCGFHLRGSEDLSSVLPEVTVSGVNNHSDLGRELIRSLAVAKVDVLNEVPVILNVTKDSFSKRVLSVDSAGRANQYELRYDVSFELLNEVKDKKEIITLIPVQNITERREYLFDADLILAKENEENRLKNNMRQAAILQLIRRLKFSLKNRNKVSK